MNERLGVFMREQNMTAAKLAEILQIQPSSISHLLSGRNKPNFDFIARILRMFAELNPDWLINGYGAMYRDQNQSTLEPKAENIKTVGLITEHNPTDLVAEKEEVTQNTNVMQSDLFSNPKNETEPTIVADKCLQDSTKRQYNLEPDDRCNSVDKTNKEEDQSAIDKIIVFYSDQTFSIYNQRQIR